MRKINWLLALAAVAMLAVGCGSDTKTTTTATTDTSTTKDTTATDTMAADMSMGDAATTTTDKGCLSATDTAYVTKLGGDATLAGKFTEDVKNCTLASAGATDQATAVAAIGKCVVGKGYPISPSCGGCYGLRGYCTFKNCVANQTESATANCIADAGGASCTACANKYNCITASDDCKAGK